MTGKRKIRTAGTALGLIFVLSGAAAFNVVPEQERWPQAFMEFNIILEGESTVFNNGFSQAVATWNDATVFAINPLGSSADPCINPNDSPAITGADFKDTLCGQEWDDTTLAVTISWSEGEGGRIQAGIAFNPGFTWNVYNGPWQAAQADFRRVAVHELGHTIGLNHENVQPSIMSTAVGVGDTIEVPQVDDVAGVNAMYGAGALPPGGSEAGSDAFAGAGRLFGASAEATGNTVGATKEFKEPDHAGHAGGASIWWSWVAPADGTAAFDTEGSEFDTLLAVYTGSSVRALTEIASDNNSSQGLTSRLQFAAEANQTYLIAVDGKDGEAGPVVISVELTAPPPANDNFAGAVAITDSVATVMGANLSATKEDGEGDHAGNEGGASVWWTWTPADSGTATVATLGSNFDTLLAVYTGSGVTSLSQVAANDDADLATLQSRVTLGVTAGQTYRIAVDGFGNGQGSVALAVAVEGAAGGPPPGPAPPDPLANDNFADATAIEGVAANLTADNTGATKETGEPNHAANAGGASLWWSWTAAENGVINVSTLGSGFDTVLAAYTGAAVDALTVIALDDDAGTALHSDMSFAAISGRIYFIAVDGFDGAEGSIALSLAFQTAARGPASSVRNDLLINLGASFGTPIPDIVWEYHNDDYWAPYDTANPANILIANVDGSGVDDVIYDLGPGQGLWIRRNNGAAVQFHASTAVRLLAADVDNNGQEDVLADFGPGQGVWINLNDGGAWTQYNVNTTDSMATGDIDGNGQTDVILSLGVNGTHANLNNGTWAQQNVLSTPFMAVGNLDGKGPDELVLSLAPFGVWVKRNYDGWERIIEGGSGDLAIGDVDNDGKDDVFAVIRVGTEPTLWLRTLDSTWRQIRDKAPLRMIVGDLDSNGGADLILDLDNIDIDNFGTWAFFNNTTWTLLNSLPPVAFATGNIDGK